MYSVGSLANHSKCLFEMFQLEDEPYNPDYVEVDRVLDMAEHTDPNTGKTIKHYLVKWRSMQYEDSTWELEEDVDPVKIQQYESNNKRPPKEKWKVRHISG
jgi:chromodomain-helicase-DNA-binding protein 7